MEADNNVVIASTERGARLTLSDFAPESDPNFYTFVATVEQPGLRASVKVYDLDGGLSSALPDYFASLEAEWRGWEGEKTWDSLEGHLTLSCTTDRSGHARLVVRMREAADWDGWSVEAVLVLDVMQRDRVAKEVRRFLPRAV